MSRKDLCQSTLAGFRHASNLTLSGYDPEWRPDADFWAMHSSAHDLSKYVFCQVLPRYTLLICTVGAEEGGPSDWPLIQKLSDVETLLNALKLCGFSWSVAKEIREAEAAVATLRKGASSATP